MLRTLSVILSDEGWDGPALAAASTIAQREDAHLEVTCVAVVPMEGVAFEVGPIVLEADRVRTRQRAEALAAWARSALPTELRASIETLMVPSFSLVDAVGQVARYSDLTVTMRPYGPGHAPSGPVIGEALLFGSGAAVLVLPDSDRTDWRRPFRRVALAWNDSIEAMHAARAALPFLRAATEVSVLVIRSGGQNDGRGPPGGALLRWLDRQGVEARICVLQRNERRKADILAHVAAERGCEALVMGAYGHSRLREALLGGTTRAMLTEVPLPLIMAH